MLKKLGSTSGLVLVGTVRRVPGPDELPPLGPSEPVRIERILHGLLDRHTGEAYDRQFEIDLRHGPSANIARKPAI